MSLAEQTNQEEQCALPPYIHLDVSTNITGSASAIFAAGCMTLVSCECAVFHSVSRRRSYITLNVCLGPGLT